MAFPGEPATELFWAPLFLAQLLRSQGKQLRMKSLIAFLELLVISVSLAMSVWTTGPQAPKLP